LSHGQWKANWAADLLDLGAQVRCHLHERDLGGGRGRGPVDAGEVGRRDGHVVGVGVVADGVEERPERRLCGEHALQKDVAEILALVVDGTGEEVAGGAGGTDGRRGGGHQRGVTGGIGALARDAEALPEAEGVIGLVPDLIVDARAVVGDGGDRKVDIVRGVGDGERVAAAVPGATVGALIKRVVVVEDSERTEAGGFEVGDHAVESREVVDTGRGLDARPEKVGADFVEGRVERQIVRSRGAAVGIPGRERRETERRGDRRADVARPQGCGRRRAGDRRQ